MAQIQLITAVAINKWQYGWDENRWLFISAKYLSLAAHFSC